MPTAERVRCIGLDLAWSARNATGAATLELGREGVARLTDSTLLGDDEEIVAWVAEQASDGPLVVAVDAPLVVPNQHGRRPAEAAVGQRFARFHAGAHPANRTKLVDPQRGVWRGEALVAALAEQRIHYATEVPWRSAGRWVVEVYPHPATITLFHLPRVLRYKRGPIVARREALATLRDHLLTLAAPRLDRASLQPLRDEPIEALKGRAYKDFEDRLDGLLCAYIAAYAWWWGVSETEVFGTREGGSILVPMPTAWRMEHEASE